MYATIITHTSRPYARRLASGLVALVLRFAGASGAAAGDTKVFPGAMCIQGDSTSTIVRNGDGRVLNNSSSPVTVICAMVHDSTAAGLGSLGRLLLLHRRTLADRRTTMCL
jgi:hypothetical protein